MELTSNDTTAPRRKRSYWRWLIKGVLIFVAVLVLVAFGFRELQLYSVPDIGDPFNVEEFGTVEIKDDDNAFIEYNQVQPPIDLPWEEWLEIIRDESSFRADDIRESVESNRPSLIVWRKGTEKPDALCYQPHTLRLSTKSPWTTKLVGLGRIACLEGLCLQREGKPIQAWEWYRSAFRCSRHLERYAPFAQRASGLVLHEQTNMAIVPWSCLSSVDAGMLRQAIDDVVHDFRLTHPAATTLKCEYIMYVDAFSKGTWKDDEPTLCDTWKEELGFFLFHEPELGIRVLQHDTAHWLKELESSELETLLLDKGNQTVVDHPRLLSKERLAEHGRRSPLFRYMWLQNVWVKRFIWREHADHRALVCTLAAQLYRRENNRFPVSMDELASVLQGYTGDLITDPYGAPGEQLRYQIDENHVTIWSLGGNEIDDSGDVEFQPDNRPTDIGYKIPILLKDSLPDAEK